MLTYVVVGEICYSDDCRVIKVPMEEWELAKIVSDAMVKDGYVDVRIEREKEE